MLWKARQGLNECCEAKIMHGGRERHTEEDLHLPWRVEVRENCDRRCGCESEAEEEHDTQVLLLGRQIARNNKKVNGEPYMQDR